MGLEFVLLGGRGCCLGLLVGVFLGVEEGLWVVGWGVVLGFGVGGYLDWLECSGSWEGAASSIGGSVLGVEEGRVGQEWGGVWGGGGGRGDEERRAGEEGGGRGKVE